MQEKGLNLVSGEPGEELLKLYSILLNSMNDNDEVPEKNARFFDELSKYHFIHYY